MKPSVNDTSELTKKTISRRKLLGAAGIGLSALPLMSTQVFAAANDATRPPTPYLASTAEKKINIISLERLEVEARGAIPKAGYEFVSGGAGDEWTLRENRRAFNDYRIAAKRLVGLSNNDIDIRTSLLGLNMPSPIMVAPMGAHMMVHEQGEKDTARGAGLAKTLYCSSGASNTTLEEIAKATSGPKWFQLYWNNDDAVTNTLTTDSCKRSGLYSDYPNR